MAARPHSQPKAGASSRELNADLRKKATFAPNEQGFESIAEENVVQNDEFSPKNAGDKLQKEPFVEGGESGLSP